MTVQVFRHFSLQM